MDGVDLDLLAASLRADSADLGAFVEGLAAKLEEMLPARTKIERARSGLFGPKQVRAITVEAAEQRLELTRIGNAIETRSSRVSGGIVLKREALDTDAWLRELGQAIGREAERSEKTRQALERLLMN
jgi:hypothetical protein